MSVGHSPIVRRRRLGAELRRLREAAGLTGDQLAARVGWSSSKVSRIENARVRPEVGDVMDVLDELGVTGAKREELIAIARDAASTRGWWRVYGDDISSRQKGYAELEAGAACIREYQLVLIPGLLQTADYARVRYEALHTIGRRDFDIDAAAAARQTRQEVLSRRKPPRYEALVDEMALRRPSCPAEVMRDQLRHLATVAERPNVTLRILPLDAEITGNYTAVNSFGIFEFTDPADPTIVVVETATSDLHLGDEEDITRYKLDFDRLTAAALSADESAALVTDMVRRR